MDELDQDPIIGVLLAYVHGVLDALAISEGPAHTELILTRNGPRLLETGARLSGLANPAALQAATGVNQVALAAEACLDPARLMQRPQRYRRLQAACTLNLISHRSSLFDLPRTLNRLKRLSSFHSARWRARDGQLLTPTVDLNSSPGVVFLLYGEDAQIARGCHEWREWERQWL